MKPCALAGPSFFADDLADTLQLIRHLLIGGNNLVKRICNFAREPRPGAWEPDGKVSVTHGLQASQDGREIGSHRFGCDIRMPITFFTRLGWAIYGGGRCVTHGSLHGRLLNERGASRFVPAR